MCVGKHKSGTSSFTPSITDSPFYDIHFMNHALALAYRAVGSTAPNPSVGCVIVRDGKVIGSAHTAKGGRPHAETQALAEAGNAANGATAYVTLEPCAHFGITPPCADALIKAGIKRVVIATLDPFHEVNGKGAAILRNAGIEVLTGICESQARKINEGFFSVQQKGRPFITLKTATSMDGKIALKDGASKWITCEASRNYVHLMRAHNDAVITGIKTIIADDPAFTCRLPGMSDRSPIRIVLDSNLSLPEESQIVQTAKITPCWIATLEETIATKSQKALDLEKSGVRLITVNKARNGKICIEDTMQKLGKNGINNAMIEAGSSINTAALNFNVVDKIYWFRAPIIIGNDGMPAFIGMDIKNLTTKNGFIITENKAIGTDSLEILARS